MNTLTRKTMLCLVAGTTLVALIAAPAAAYRTDALRIAPELDFCPTHLPRFGFSSYNIAGVGERVTLVRIGSRAARLGLEPGDIIVRLNGFPLTYHGAWNVALHHAVASGGWVRLTIRDVRTGRLVTRLTYVGEGRLGPITPKVHAGGHPSRELHELPPWYATDMPNSLREPEAGHTLKNLAKWFEERP